MIDQEIGNQCDISVRVLAEYVYRSGGLSTISFSGISGAEGTRLHRRVFADLRAQYLPSSVETEVALTGEYASDSLTLCVRGRADCILHSPDSNGERITVVEIKSCSSEVDTIKSILQPAHWAQAMLYAHLYLLLREELHGIYVSLRYVSIETLHYAEELAYVTRDEANIYFANTCAAYMSFAENLAAYKNDRDQTIKAMRFPYATIRGGQKVFMNDCLAAIAHRDLLFVEAPTGIGKTISVLYPAIKALAHNKCDKIFYLTAKSSTRHVAEKALDDMRGEGLLLRSITLQSKESLCPCPDIYCDAEICPFAKGYYDRLNVGIKDLSASFSVTPTILKKTAIRHSLCPHELALDYSLLCDVIIGDYNHAFHPRVKLDRYFNQPELHHALLIDEAHNLVDRSRDMYTAELSLSSLLAAKTALIGMDARVDGYLADILSYFSILGSSIRRDEPAFPHVEKEIENSDVLTSGKFRAARKTPKMLYKILWKFCFYLRPVLDSIPAGELRRDILQFYFDARFFLSVLELYYDDSYVTSAELTEVRGLSETAEDLIISLLCLDASEKIFSDLTDKHAAVFFSATLSPTVYYTSMLIGEKHRDMAGVLRLSSPFPEENLRVGVYTDLKTTYQERNFSLEKAAEAIYTITKGKIGNYMIFLPSFAYLSKLTDSFRRVLSSASDSSEIMAQSSTMLAAEKTAFLERFDNFGKGSLYAFAVLGGHFGEGIDLVGERLSGVIVVGVGLPQISPQREIMRQYFQEKFGDGFGYAYRYPGWEKVLQASGRVIRSEEDTGFVFLMDERYNKQEYLSLFPENWHAITVTDPADFA